MADATVYLRRVGWLVVVTMLLVPSLGVVTTAGAQSFSYYTDFAVNTAGWTLNSIFHNDTMHYIYSTNVLPGGTARYTVNHSGGQLNIQMTVRKMSLSSDISTIVFDGTTDYCIKENWLAPYQSTNYQDYRTISYSCTPPAGNYTFEIAFFGDAHVSEVWFNSEVPTPTPTYTPEPTTTAVPPATYTPEPTITPIPTATPNYGRIITATVGDLPHDPPTGGVDLAALGLPPLPQAQGLLDPSSVPENQRLNIPFTLADLSLLVSTGLEVPEYLFSNLLWRLLLFFGMLAFAVRKMLQFHSSTTGAQSGGDTPTHINNRK